MFNIDRTLVLHLIGDKEYLEFCRKRIDELFFCGLEKKKLNKLGDFYLEIINNTPSIIEYLEKIKVEIKECIKQDKSYLTLDTYFYSKIYNKNNINNIFIDFILESLRKYSEGQEKKLDEHTARIKDYNNEINRNQALLNSDKNLNEYFEDLEKNYMEILENENKSEFEIEEILNKYVPKTQNERKLLIVKEIEENQRVIDSIKNNTLSWFSEEKTVENLILKLDEIIINLKNNLISVNYYFNINKDNYSDDFLNYLNGILEIPYNRRYFTIEKDDLYITYESVFNQMCENSNNTSKFSVIEKLKTPIICNTFYIETVKNILDIYLNYFMEKNIKICKCQNCGKYFIPSVRSDEKYCENIFKNNLTCREYAPSIAYRKGIEDDEVKKRVYNFRNRLYNRISRTKDWKKIEVFKKTLENFNNQFAEKNNLLKKEEFDKESLIIWLDKFINDFENKYVSKNKKG